MADLDMSVALICGVSEGLGSALCNVFAAKGMVVAGISRTASPLQGDQQHAYRCDLNDPDQAADIIDKIEAEHGPIEVMVHNIAAFSYGPFLEVALEDFEQAWSASTRSAFIAAQQVLPRMLARGHGSLLYSGATASLRGSEKFSALAASKFSLRGFAQSLAREFGPQGIHVAHVILDGVIWCDWTRERFSVKKELCLDPREIAEVYVQLHEQPRSAWTQEIDLRPASEKF